MDLSLNQIMISKIKTAGGTMDNPKSKDDDSISKFILNCLLTIFSNNNERKTEFENYLKESVSGCRYVDHAILCFVFFFEI